MIKILGRIDHGKLSVLKTHLYGRARLIVVDDHQ